MGGGAMRHIGGTVALGLVMGWLVFWFAGLFASPLGALIWAIVIAGVAVTALWDSVPVAGAMAVLAPFGVMLPALALRHVLVQFGMPVPGFSSLEIGIFLLVYMVFLLTAFGVIPADLYRYGYAPWPVAGMVLAVCFYALVTGNWFLAGVAVFGQLAWVMGWGSSNWFDMMLHVLLVPVAVVTFILRLF